MSAYDDTRSGNVCYSLEIAGFGVFSDVPIDYAGEAWYDDAGYTEVHPWLCRDFGEYSERIDTAVAECDVGGLALVIADPASAMTTLVKSHRAWTYTWLTATLSSTEVVTIHVVSTADLPAAGAVHIHLERIEYTGKTPITLTGLTRGTHGTQAAEHYADDDPPDGTAPITPVVATGPHSITGRRATLRASVVDESSGAGPVFYASEIRYRGRVLKGTTIDYGAYRVQLEHIIAYLDDKVGTALPDATLRQGYWYNGRFEAWALSVITWWDDLNGRGYPHVSAGWYWPIDLVHEVNDVMEAYATGAGVTSWHVDMGVEKAVLWITTPGENTNIRIRRGDPLWALGFSEMTHVCSTGASYVVEAEDPPRWCVIDLTAAAHGGVGGNPEIHVDSTYRLEAGNYIAPEGAIAVKIDSITDEHIFDLDIGGIDVTILYHRGDWVWLIDEEEDAGIAHLIAIRQSSLRYSLRQCLRLGPAPIEPESWLPRGLTADDVDDDELQEALRGVPHELSRSYPTAFKPAKVLALLGPQLALLGICPRITDEGRIGFTRIATPLLSNAKTLDADTWSVDDVASTRARQDDQLVVDEIRVKFDLDYTQGDQAWHEATFHWREGSVTGRARGLVFTCPGIITGDMGRSAAIMSMQQVLTLGLFSSIGRETSIVEIPCVWRSRRLRCGDVVVVTHPLAPDAVMGVTGMVDRLGMIIGRRHNLLGDRPDTISVRFGPAVNAGGIAPCVLISSDNNDDIGTVADNTIHSEDNDDLSYFAAGEEVRLIEYDSDAPQVTSGYSITAIGAGTVTLDAFGDGPFDPATDNMPTPCWMVSALWGAASDALKTYAFVADRATAPTLGAGGDDPKEWTI